MKQFIFILSSIFFTLTTLAQGEIVVWEASANALEKNSYELVFKAAIAPGWHIYSQKISDEDMGPIPTEFSFKTAEGNFDLSGTTVEPEGVAKFDKTFDMEVTYFEEEAFFRQKILVKNAAQKTVAASVLFMVCNDEMCLPPETIDFEIPLAGSAPVQAANNLQVSAEDLQKTEQLNIQVKGWEKYPQEDPAQQGYFTIFFLGFLGGLIALLTPCVFPMIPLTVSFFTKRTKDKRKGKFNAFLYGFFIFAIYVLLSLPFHLLDSLDPEILNNVSTNFTLNIIFFVIFVAFAVSFFGYYELTLPASWSNKMDDQATKIGGVLGIFFMALTLALVSFSCTGPILGSLLGGTLSRDGGAIQLTIGMGGFGLALALPFALFALFPNWLNSLPKSGGWLNSVKVVLGFLELALAFKFLSNAELVMHWGIFKREIFIGIWILIGIGLALYLFGKIRFPHDSPITKLPVWRKVLGTVTVAFVLYLIPGLTNTSYANLKLLSGFPPPLFYSVYEKPASHEMMGLEAYKSFDAGLKAAKEQHKPLLLDFTGWACVNCRKMEEQVWSISQVNELIRERYILVSLYVDDRENLPKETQFNYLKSSGRVKKIKTVGDKWATFQTLNFKNNSQPYYVLLGTNGELLNAPLGYTPDVNEYTAWLQKGLENFEL